MSSLHRLIARATAGPSAGGPVRLKGLVGVSSLRRAGEPEPAEEETLQPTTRDTEAPPVDDTIAPRRLPALMRQGEETEEPETDEAVAQSLHRAGTPDTETEYQIQAESAEADEEEPVAQTLRRAPGETPDPDEAPPASAAEQVLPPDEAEIPEAMQRMTEIPDTEDEPEVSAARRLRREAVSTVPARAGTPLPAAPDYFPDAAKPPQGLAADVAGDGMADIHSGQAIDAGTPAPAGGKAAVTIDQIDVIIHEPQAPARTTTSASAPARRIARRYLAGL